MTTSDNLDAICAALAKAQGAMKPATKDATNPHFKSKYADLAANVEAARKPMADNGLSYVQEPVTTPGGVACSTRLLHSSGQWIHFEPLTVPCSKNDAHGVGSAVTYARRYSLGAALGLVADDDDANAAVSKGNGASEPIARALPHGYAAWLDDMRAAADEGTAQLEKAWKASRSEYRAHITATEPATWENLKKIAATRQQVTA